MHTLQQSAYTPEEDFPAWVDLDGGCLPPTHILSKPVFSEIWACGLGGRGGEGTQRNK